MHVLSGSRLTIIHMYLPLMNLDSEGGRAIKSGYDFSKKQRKNWVCPSMRPKTEWEFCSGNATMREAYDEV